MIPKFDDETVLCVQLFRKEFRYEIISNFTNSLGILYILFINIDKFLFVLKSLKLPRDSSSTLEVHQEQVQGNLFGS